MTDNEGRHNPASTEADARLLNGPWGWLLITVMAVLWAMASVGFA